MTLVNPLALWLFALAGVVVLVYFLRRRAEVYRVSALFLWRWAEERDVRRPRLARRPLWLLLLQLLALALLVLALADPACFLAGTPGKLAILIDGSASMLAAEGGKARYELAVERGLELIDSAAGEVTVIQAKRRPKVIVPLTRDKGEARALLRRARPTLEGNAPPGELLELLKSQAPLSRFQRIVWIGDRPPELEGLPLETVLVGGAARNLGLTAIAAREEPGPGLGYAVFIRAENYTGHRARPTLRVIADGEEVLSEEIDLPAHGARVVAFSRPAPLPGRLTAALEVEDDFPWDDRRYLARQERRRKVLWLGREDRFLRGALEAAEDLLIEREGGEYDLIVAVGTEVPSGLKGSILLVNSAYPPLLRLLGTAEVHLPLEARPHPLLAGVDVNDILVTKAARVALPPGGVVLWSAEDLPLLYVKQEKDRKICYLGLDLRWSNLPLTVDFPILMKNLLGWLLPPEAGGLEVGEPLPLEGATAVTDPQGKTYQIRLDEPWLIAELPGFYRIGEDQAAHYLAVNLPPEESDLGPRSGMEGIRSLERSRPSGRFPRPLWRYLALGGLLVLALELWSYERVPLWRRR